PSSHAVLSPMDCQTCPPPATLYILSLHDALPILIVVLAIMNGFASELRGRILSLVPHGFVESSEGGITQWPELMAELASSPGVIDRKSTRLNSSHVKSSYDVFCLKKKKK